MQFKDFKVGYSTPWADKPGPVGPVSGAPGLLHDIREQLELRLVSDTSTSLMDEAADGVTEPRGTLIPNETLPRQETALATTLVIHFQTAFTRLQAGIVCLNYNCVNTSHSRRLRGAILQPPPVPACFGEIIGVCACRDGRVQRNTQHTRHHVEGDGGDE